MGRLSPVIRQRAHYEYAGTNHPPTQNLTDEAILPDASAPRIIFSRISVTGGEKAECLPHPQRLGFSLYWFSEGHT